MRAFYEIFKDWLTPAAVVGFRRRIVAQEEVSPDPGTAGAGNVEEWFGFRQYGYR
jgi:hypothetical protein